VVSSQRAPVMVGLRAEVAGSSRSRASRVLRDEEKKLRAEYASRYAALTPPIPGSSLGVRVASSAAVEQSERVRDARFQYSRW